MSDTFGRLLNMYRSKKQLAIQSARDELKRRNGVDYKNAQAFRVEEQEIALPNGKNVTELRLWKLIDATVVTVDPDVEVTTTEGITELGDFHKDPTHPLYIDPASLKDEDKPGEPAKSQEDEW